MTLFWFYTAKWTTNKAHTIHIHICLKVKKKIQEKSSFFPFLDKHLRKKKLEEITKSSKNYMLKKLVSLKIPNAIINILNIQL